MIWCWFLSIKWILRSRSSDQSLKGPLIYLGNQWRFWGIEIEREAGIIETRGYRVAFLLNQAIPRPLNLLRLSYFLNLVLFDFLLWTNHAIELLKQAGLGGPSLLIAWLLSPETAPYQGIPAGIIFDNHHVSAAADGMRKDEWGRHWAVHGNFKLLIY